MRTFIVTPPQDLCHLFTPVTSSLSDEIAAHTLLFDRNSNTDYYYVLLMETAKLVEKTVTVAIKG